MDGGFFSRPRPRLFGHRGAAGVTPENTLPSFHRALEDGADTLELDVHASRDGVIVVIHDDTLDRTTDGLGAVRDLTFEEIRRHDAGYRFQTTEGAFPYRRRGIRVPALTEVLDEFPSVPLNIEIKQADPPIEQAVVSLLRGLGWIDRVVLAAEVDQVMKRIRESAPEALTSFSVVEATDFFQRCFANDFGGYTPPGKALQIPQRFETTELATSETVAAAHRLGLEMHVWTVNERSEMDRLLALGVDGLMSDFPARLRDAAARIVRTPSTAAGAELLGTAAPEKGKPAEQRRHPRSTLGAKGVVRFADGRTVPAMFGDVSFGGVSAEIAGSSEPATYIGKDVSVEIPSLVERSQGRLGVLTGKIVRERRIETGRVSLGVRFSAGVTAKLKIVLSGFHYE